MFTFTVEESFFSLNSLLGSLCQNLKPIVLIAGLNYAAKTVFSSLCCQFSSIKESLRFVMIAVSEEAQ